MNVKSKERLDKRRKPHVYKNVGRLQQEVVTEGCEGYQVVHERGLDPNGEYTDLTARITSGQVDDATLQREQMINDLLFPQQKNAPRRFNYTDIQLTPANIEDEEQLPFDVCDSPSEQTKDNRKPMTMPKPRILMKNSRSEDSDSEDEDFAEEEAVQATIDEGAVEGTVSTVDEEAATSDRLGGCTWKAYGIKIVYTVLLVACICISLVAVAVAVVALVKPSGVCEQIILYEECGITVGDANNCTTPGIPLITKEVRVRVRK